MDKQKIEQIDGDLVSGGIVEGGCIPPFPKPKPQPFPFPGEVLF